MAWDDVPENVIRRCWIKAAVFPAPSVAYINQDVNRPSATDKKAMDALTALLASSSIQAKASVIDGFSATTRVDSCSSALLDYDIDELAMSIDIDIEEIVEKVKTKYPAATDRPPTSASAKQPPAGRTSISMEVAATSTSAGGPDSAHAAPNTMMSWCAQLKEYFAHRGQAGLLSALDEMTALIDATSATSGRICE